MAWCAQSEGDAPSLCQQQWSEAVSGTRAGDRLHTSPARPPPPRRRYCAGQATLALPSVPPLEYSPRVLGTGGTGGAGLLMTTHRLGTVRCAGDNLPRTRGSRALFFLPVRDVSNPRKRGAKVSHVGTVALGRQDWIPAFAGMTRVGSRAWPASLDSRLRGNDEGGQSRLAGKTGVPPPRE
jgi:hypothetical protein